MAPTPQHWMKMRDLYVQGLLSESELIAAFLDRVDLPRLEDELRSLPAVLSGEIARHFRATPLSVPKPFLIGPATPEELREVEDQWRAKADLVVEFLKRVPTA